MINLNNVESSTDTLESLEKFLTSFTAWTNKEEYVCEYLKDEFISWDNWDNGYYYSNINYDEEYKLYYGEPYYRPVMEGQGIQIEEFKKFLEIMYERWIKTEKRYCFTVEINKLFGKFSLPYKLSGGKVIRKGYKTTKTVDAILNLRMFEQKITYSEEMINSSEMLDKKVALDCIVDALQYYISIQNANDIKGKYSAASKSVCDDVNSKQYAVINKEIEEVMKIANEYFDIRHNEYLNKSKQKRDILDDINFIEYLYNRIYALLYLLRLNSKKDNLIC
jgi:hypothetical protein